MIVFKVYPVFISLLTGLLISGSWPSLLQQDMTLSYQHQIIPIPKDISLDDEVFSFTDTLYLFTNDENLSNLIPVLHNEFMSMHNIFVKQVTIREQAELLLLNSASLADEEYILQVNSNISVTGGSYQAVAMGTVSILQMIYQKGDDLVLPAGTIHDLPDMHFRGVMIDVARKKHSIEVLKQVVSLCRWYKLNYLQLHLTDEHFFSFPSDAYPQLSTKNFHYSKKELIDLVQYADERGVEIIPELEVPGHAGQFVQHMPDIFGFPNKKLNRFTINMANDEVYPVLDTLIGEIAEVFHSSEYIHIGGDEADFSGMQQEPEVQQYLKNNNLESVDELFWHFINRMNDMVKKRNRKTIVWEGFGSEANMVVSKDIIVMAWETMYQLPEELLDSGYNIINVSWKPLYVVNNRKWSPAEIYEWNVYLWQNWFPKAPSYIPIQIDEHPNVLGAFMASWDQPEYVEISSLRKRLPAMVERVWNKNRNISTQAFLASVDLLDEKLNSFFSPVILKVDGLQFPEISDGFRHEQVWFNDTLTAILSAPENFIIRYSLDEPLSDKSSVYVAPIKISETATLRYRAFSPEGQLAGNEILKYYELNPVIVSFKDDQLLFEPEYWGLNLGSSIIPTA